jgi:hypothetical protein
MEVIPREGANAEQALIAEELIEFFTTVWGGELLGGIREDAEVTSDVRKILEDWGLDLKVG